MAFTDRPERVRISAARKRIRWVPLFFALVATLANAETSTRLIPGAELVRPVLLPGTLAQDPPPTQTPATPTPTQPAPNTQNSAPADPSSQSPSTATPATQTPGDKIKPWDSGLHINILQGDRGANIIKSKTAVTPVVEVKDRNNLPVAGVLVLFSSPTDGPSVTFMNGERSFSVVTDADGKASATGVKPNNAGSFQVHVSATYQSETATADIAMTNYLTAADAANAGATGAGAATGMSHTTLLILVGVAAAAAVGIGVGLGGHSSSSSSGGSSTSATIGVGSGGSVTAPH